MCDKVLKTLWHTQNVKAIYDQNVTLKCMNYWDSGLNALDSRTFITIIHITILIGWRCLRKERIG
jgi:hypothetical protein